jgi:AAA ATPase domain
MRLTQFRVENYRSIKSTDWINVTSITAFVGQNEAGKSNLCEALFRINPYVAAQYVVDEDWPVDDWGKKDPNGLVCEARFELVGPQEISTLLTETGMLAAGAAVVPGQFPDKVLLRVSKFYNNTRKFMLETTRAALDTAKAEAWAESNLPRCVYIQEYDFSGSRTELTELKTRRDQKKWHELSVEDQTILIVLDLARVNIEEFIKKGETKEGRTLACTRFRRHRVRVF